MPACLPTQSRHHRWRSQPCRHRRTAESGRVEGRVERARALARGGCSGRQTAARPASQAAARSTRSVRPNLKSPRQPAPQRSRLQVVRACVRAARIGAESREGGSCGGGFPAGGAGRRTVAWLASVSIATTEAVGAAAVAGSSAPRWRGCDQSARWSADTARARRAGRGNGRTGTLQLALFDFFEVRCSAGNLLLGSLRFIAHSS